MLGIVIGVGAVIAMVGVGQGAENQVQQQIESFGTNTIFISAGSPSRGHGGMRFGSWAVKTLTVDDMDAILREVPLVRDAAPGVMDSAQVVYGNQNWFTRVMGTTSSYFIVRNWAVEAGSMFSEEDVLASANVCVLGKTVAQLLFADEDPVGRTIRIKNMPFRIAGVLASKGQSGMGDDQDDRIFAPYPTVQKKLKGQDWLQFISASAISREASVAAVPQIEGLLRERHRIRPGEDDDFQVRTQSEVADLAQATGRIMTVLLGSIASISLLVGGIGIMNIMLVSVTERTREIGIRMAVGATENDIQRQFLVEAITLSLLGGAVGISLGVLASTLISSFLQWPTLISPAAVGLAAMFSAGVGIFFGYYPARKAARLDPIEALRYE
ncbi:MAG: ABC transporter permease [Acidobacteria bacterium]|nr:ABC transporter permease [Acidobacteriota bacterium]